MKPYTIHTANYAIEALRQTGSNGHTILALHGWLDNAASFLPLSQHLKQYTLIAIDMVGHGNSSHRSTDAHYHLMDWVQDLYQVLEALDIQKVILLGHSLGGIVSSVFAACFPERVEKLIMIESAGPLSKSPDTSATQIRDSILSREKALHSKVKHPKDLTSVVRARMLAGNLNAEHAELLVTRNLVRVQENWQWRSDPRLRTLSSLRLTDPQAENIVANIDSPTKLILGENGFEKIVRLVEQRKNLFKDITLATVPGGHHCHMEFPQETAALIDSFLK